MAGVSSFPFLVVLFFLVPIERGSGLPTKIKAKDHEESLSEKEKVHIREVIRLALEEFKDEDVMHVLQESLELRFKICFSPFPSSPVSPNEMSDSNGIIEDEQFTPEQKKGLRELLLECLEHFDEQEMLDFLKHSIEFRVQYCPWPGDFLNPGPEPGPHTTPRSVTERSIPNTSAKPTGASAGDSLGSAANTVGPLPKASTSIGVAAEGDQPTETNVEYVAADMPRLSEEDALSGISRGDEMSPSVRDEPSQAQITGNDALAKLDKAAKKLASHPELQSRHRIVGKDTTAKLAKRVPNKLGPHNSKLSLTGLVSDKELIESLVSEADPSEMAEKPEQSNERSIVDAPEEVTELAKRVTKKLGAPNSKPSLSDLVSDNEQTESTVNETDTSKTEETESDDQSIVGPPEQAAAEDLMAVNSDEGEFASVMKIDYNTLAHHDSGPGVDEVDLGLIAESNEELS